MLARHCKKLVRNKLPRTLRVNDVGACQHCVEHEENQYEEADELHCLTAQWNFIDCSCVQCRLYKSLCNTALCFVQSAIFKRSSKYCWQTIGVGAQSTLGGHTIFARKMCVKNQQNARILHDSCPKNYQNTLIFLIFARKMYKIPKFYMIFARKMPEFYIIIARQKYFFPNFRGARAPSPAPPSPAPMWQTGSRNGVNLPWTL